MSLFKKKETAGGSAKERDKEREAQSKHKNKDKTQKEKRKIKRTTIQTLPYECFVSNYVMLNKTGVRIGKQTANLYSKTYLVPDINYSSVTMEQQEELQELYIELLNGFDDTSSLQVSILNTQINKEEFSEKLLLHNSPDGLNELRHEFNSILMDKVIHGQNGLKCRKLFTVTVAAINFDAANTRFFNLEAHMINCLNRMGTELIPLTASGTGLVEEQEVRDRPHSNDGDSSRSSDNSLNAAASSNDIYAEYLSTLKDTRFTSLTEAQRFDFEHHSYVATPENSIWYEVEHSYRINNGIFEVSTPTHGGIMIKSDIARLILSKEAQNIAQKERGWYYFEEDCDYAVAKRELLDKNLFSDIDDYFSRQYNKKTAEYLHTFSNNLNESLQHWNKNEYWDKRETALFNALSPEEQAAEIGQDYVESVLSDNDIAATVGRVIVSGSRSRGLEKPDSDIDVVVEIDSELREDALFNILHENEREIGGFTVDINPIRKEETGTLETYLPNVEKYLSEKSASIAAPDYEQAIRDGFSALYANHKYSDKQKLFLEKIANFIKSSEQLSITTFKEGDSKLIELQEAAVATNSNEVTADVATSSNEIEQLTDELNAQTLSDVEVGDILQSGIPRVTKSCPA